MNLGSKEISASNNQIFQAGAIADLGGGIFYVRPGRMLAGFIFLLLLLLGKAALADPVDWPTLGLNQVTTTTFSQPTVITHATDNSGRIFVVEQPGRIRIIEGSNVLASPFLDISGRVLYGAGGEQGLLGLAFPPGFKTNGHVYVDYTRTNDGAIVISRFFISVNNTNAANASSEAIIKVIPKSYSYHNGGGIAFGPDGFLYIGVGDGGPEGDTQNNAQNTGTLLGKLLRIDVEKGVSPYAVPTNNPFVGNTNYLPEIWALGLRNPWRFSFDRVTGDLYIGDVGQNRYEEVDFQTNSSAGGQNYGWRIREGATNYNVPAGFTNFPALAEPVTWYDHLDIPTDIGGAVTGGQVYRGPDAPRLNGIYFFGDFVAGWIWGLKSDGTNWQRVEMVNPTWGVPHMMISTFGEDDAGQIYLADYNPGKIYRLQDTRQVVTPTFSAHYGGINSNYVYVSCLTTGAVIHITTNNIDPTPADPVIASGGKLTVAVGVAYKLRAYRADLTPSLVALAGFSPQTGAPVFSPPAGPIPQATLVVLSSVTPNAVIYYTTNGTTPNSGSAVYATPLILSGGASVQAYATAPGMPASGVATATYTSAQVITPVFVPSGATITNGTRVVMSCATPGAVIRYTTDGTDPTSGSPSYAGPVTINGNSMLKAFATASGYLDSSIQAVFYPLSDYKYPMIVTTVAGNGQAGASNGVGVTATFRSPQGICVDAAGNLYVADTGNNQIRKITPAGAASSLVVTGLAAPTGICLDPAGRIFVADSGNNRIVKIDGAGNLTVYVGTGVNGYVDGAATNAQFGNLRFLKSDLQTNLYVGDWGAVRKIAPDGTVSSLAGTANYYDLGTEVGLSVNASNYVYAGSSFGRVFEISPFGGYGIFAGGQAGYGDGPRLQARFTTDYTGQGRDTAVDRSGNIYVSDVVQIRKIDTNGWVSTLAGSTLPGFVNGDAHMARFYKVAGMCVDTNGNLYVADADNNAIRKISPDTTGIGIADDWQMTYFGHVGIDPNADPDHDGMSNYLEFWSGTNPTNAASFFAMKSLVIAAGNHAQIKWPTVAGKTYTVQYSDDLLTWNPLGNPLVGDGTTNVVSDPVTTWQAPHRMYRVYLAF